MTTRRIKMEFKVIDNKLFVNPKGRTVKEAILRGLEEEGYPPQYSVLVDSNVRGFLGKYMNFWETQAVIMGNSVIKMMPVDDYIVLLCEAVGPNMKYQGWRLE